VAIRVAVPCANSVNNYTVWHCVVQAWRLVLVWEFWIWHLLWIALAVWVLIFNKLVRF